jgi:hypothetical protein
VPGGRPGSGARTNTCSSAPLSTLPSGTNKNRPNGRFVYLADGARTAHPDWMAAVRIELPPELELEEGDF